MNHVDGSKHRRILRVGKNSLGSVDKTKTRKKGWEACLSEKIKKKVLFEHGNEKQKKNQVL